MNDARLSEDDEDETVEIDELEENEQSNGSKHVLGAEPPQVQYLVERQAALNEDKGQ